MEQQPKQMKPIWYFVGLMLTVMGAVILISGIANYISPSSTQTILSELHPELWWGCVMIVVGIVFLLGNRKKSVS